MKRNGSALLIVLGMMAFMIVSAVSFAAYMRYSRLPSSYLRRTSSSRQLVKAAIARAIDAIDLSIANNPHPGVGSEHVSMYDSNKNIWYGRVLCATNQLLESSQTVPVLTLEGLAYLPPSLVNDVRYFSRKTPTARWQQFGFDMGRYAFCAVDVSDYFDVNRMSANSPRSSCPARRMSLAYLFENGVEHTSAGSGADEWDTFMEQFRSPNDVTLSYKYDTLVPLVSVADLNLALGESGRGGFISPFCRYISTSGGDGFYNASGDDEKDKFRRMTFVTDSWFPSVSTAEEESEYDEILDLSDPKNQPFPMSVLGGSSGPKSSARTTTIMDAVNAVQQRRFVDELPSLGIAMLYDYLDTDNVPISLACPTFERAPMICGIKPNINVNFKLKLDEALAKKVTDAEGNDLPDVGTAKQREAYATYDYTIDPEFLAGLAGSIETLVAYPFAHEDGVKDTSFKIDGRATFFFTEVGEDGKGKMTLRSGKDENGEKIHFKSKTDVASTGLKAGEGVILLPFTEQPKNFNVSSVSDESDVLETVTLRVPGLNGAEANGKSFARLKYKWTQTLDSESGQYKPETKPASAEIVEARCDVPPLTAEGVVDGNFASAEKFLGIVNGGSTRITLNMAIAVRVTDSSGSKTYDLVPAHLRDDNTFNNVNNWSSFGPKGAVGLGERYPVMRFDTDVVVTLSEEGLQSAVSGVGSGEPKPKSVCVEDPRFNYAPESWYDSKGNIDKESWLSENISKNRDGDIFLATSDQGYLQSIYELAFLPRLSNLNGNNGGQNGALQNPEGRTTFGERENTANRDLMWSSYRPFATKAGDADNFEGLGFTSAGTGMQINPYTDCTNIMMAAFANTPVDWRMASTNNYEIELETMKASDFNKKYAWNEYGASKFKWKDLEAIAGNFIDRICPPVQRVMNGSYTKWQTAWRNLGWMYDPDKPDEFCGITLSGDSSELWGVDRKFLYGFWRDCFAAKQQLFLVFVRAEPLMMGGEGINQSPPQLGARAVALVWRDPAKSTATTAGGNDGYPHRTRILFYRQFE